MATPRRLALAVAVSAITIAALGTSTAGAGLFGCSYPTVSQPFGQFGDWTKYYLSPGGSFENGTPWQLSRGAFTTGGNESFYVHSTADSRSLLLPGGAVAQGPSSCIFGTDLKVRLFARSDTSAPLRVDITVPSVLGLVRVVSSYTISTTPDWQPTTTIVNLANVLSLTSLSSANISVRVSSPTDSTVQVDDVYIDPTWVD